MQYLNKWTTKQDKKVRTFLSNFSGEIIQFQFDATGVELSFVWQNHLSLLLSATCVSMYSREI